MKVVSLSRLMQSVIRVRSASGGVDREEKWVPRTPNEKGYITIGINQEDFGTLCICALRYCHGRQTYMPGLVQDIVDEHFHDLSESVLGVITEDEQYQEQMDLWADVIPIQMAIDVSE